MRKPFKVDFRVGTISSKQGIESQIDKGQSPLHFQSCCSPPQKQASTQQQQQQQCTQTAICTHRSQIRILKNK